MSHLHHMNCGCDPQESMRETALAAKKFARFPDLSTQRACGLDGRPIDLTLLNAAVNVAVWDPSLRTLKLIDGLISNIVNGCDKVVDPLPADQASFYTLSCQWETPLIGILNVSVAIQKDPRGRDDNAIMRNIRRDAKKMVGVIWKDLNRLLPPGPDAEFRRLVVAKTLHCLVVGQKMGRDVLDDNAAALLMYCYTNMTRADPARRDEVAQIISNIYTRKWEPEELTLAPDLHDQAVRAIDINTLIMKYAEWLTAESVIDQALTSELNAIRGFTVCERPFARAFVTGQTHENTIVALKRQRKLGTNPRESELVYDAGFYILNYVPGEDREFVRAATEHQLPFDSVVLAAHALCTAAELNMRPEQIIEQTYWMYANQFAHIAECTRPDCPRKSTPEFLRLLKVQVKKAHVPTMHRLRRLGCPHNDAVLPLWMRLARFAQVSEQEIRMEWQANGECHNPTCISRDEANLKMKKCGRCGEVRYCSTVCQKSDWKEHKPQCKRS